MHRVMQVVVVLLGLVAAAAIATALARRGQRSTAIELALGNELQPGLSLAETTALLRRLNVPFTVDSTAEGTAIVKYGRKVARETGGSSVTEQHLVFDRQGRLREMSGVAQISGH